MGANDGGIDHLDAVVARPGFVQSLQHHVPDARQRPAPELAADRVPLIKMTVQVTPGRARASDPEDPIKH